MNLQDNFCYTDHAESFGSRVFAESRENLRNQTVSEVITLATWRAFADWYGLLGCIQKGRGILKCKVSFSFVWLLKTSKKDTTLLMSPQAFLNTLSGLHVISFSQLFQADWTNTLCEIRTVSSIAIPLYATRQWAQHPARDYAADPRPCLYFIENLISKG